MAKLITQTLVITISEMIKDSEAEHELLSYDTITQIQDVVQQLAQADTKGAILVEIQTA